MLEANSRSGGNRASNSPPRITLGGSNITIAADEIDDDEFRQEERPDPTFEIGDTYLDLAGLVKKKDPNAMKLHVILHKQLVAILLRRLQDKYASRIMAICGNPRITDEVTHLPLPDGGGHEAGRDRNH